MVRKTIAGAAATIGADTFWGMLSEPERTQLSDRAVQRIFPPGRTLLREGEPGSFVMILVRGWAKATVHTGNGEEVLLRIYGPGDLVGSEALADLPRSESVTPLVDARSLVLSANHFADLLSRRPAIAQAVSVIMVQRAQAADQQARARFDWPRARLARVLVNLADQLGIQEADGVTIPVELSQTDLASWIGASRSTVARELHQMRHTGLIRTGYRKITITNPAAMQRAASETGVPPFREST